MPARMVSTPPDMDTTRTAATVMVPTHMDTMRMAVTTRMEVDMATNMVAAMATSMEVVMVVGMVPTNTVLTAVTIMGTVRTVSNNMAAVDMAVDMAVDTAVVATAEGMEVVTQKRRMDMWSQCSSKMRMDPQSRRRLNQVRTTECDTCDVVFRMCLMKV